MPSKSKPAPPHGRTAIHDAAEKAWRAEAEAHWQAAGGRIARYQPPPLPAWSAPAHVRRRLLGRFLFDRDTKLVHDVSQGRETCAIDGIRNGTFVHFASELDTLPADAVDCTCMGG